MCLEQRGKGAMEGGRGPEHREGCGMGALCRDTAMSQVWAPRISRWSWVGGQMGRMMSGWVGGCLYCWVGWG